MTTTSHNLGCTHQAIVDLIQVKECSERALDIRLKSEGLSQVDVATIYNKLGDVHHDMGGLQQAQDCYDKALSIFSTIISTSSLLSRADAACFNVFAQRMLDIVTQQNLACPQEIA